MDNCEECRSYEQAVKELEEKVKRENKSHNYHCKESQRKNDVIHDLKEKLEKAQSTAIEIAIEHNKTTSQLAKSITILTRYRSDYSVQEFLKELGVNNE